LPNTHVNRQTLRIDFPNQAAKVVRADQFQAAPPVGRIVVDLTSPVTWSWEPAGNRVWIRLHSSEKAARPAEAVAPARSPAQRTVVFGGRHLATGSSVTAGADTSVIQLERGGEVRVCPGTTVSVTSSRNGQALMLGMSTGALETHYALGTAADSILTPDFRI